MGFETTRDIEIYKLASKKINSIVITTKDIDFTELSDEIGPPPKILYLNIGNVSNKKLKEIVHKTFKDVIKMFLETRDSLIEISI